MWYNGVEICPELVKRLAIMSMVQEAEEALKTYTEAVAALQILTSEFGTDAVAHIMEQNQEEDAFNIEDWLK